MIYTALFILGFILGKKIDPELLVKPDGLYLTIKDGTLRSKVRITTLIHS